LYPRGGLKKAKRKKIRPILFSDLAEEAVLVLVKGSERGKENAMMFALYVVWGVPVLRAPNERGPWSLKCRACKVTLPV